MTTSNVKLLPLPGIRSRFDPMDWHAIEAFATNYALANVEANTEALRAEVAEWKASYQQTADASLAHAERAERLAEALREIEVLSPLGWRVRGPHYRPRRPPPHRRTGE